MLCSSLHAMPRFALPCNSRLLSCSMICQALLCRKTPVTPPRAAGICGRTRRARCQKKKLEPRVTRSSGSGAHNNSAKSPWCPFKCVSRLQNGTGPPVPFRLFQPTGKGHRSHPCIDHDLLLSGDSPWRPRTFKTTFPGRFESSGPPGEGGCCRAGQA